MGDGHRTTAVTTQASVVIPILPLNASPEQAVKHINSVLPRIGAALRHLTVAASGVSGVPVLVNAITSYDGTQVILTFSQPMSTPPAAPAGFAVELNSAADVVTAVALGSNITQIILTLTTPTVVGTDTLTVAYTAGTVASAGGSALASFTSQDVTNALAPVEESGSAAYNADGVTFTLVNGYTDRPVATVYGEDGGNYSLAWTQATVGGVADCYSAATVMPVSSPTPPAPPSGGTTFDPSNLGSNITLSNGDLTAQAAQVSVARSTTSKSSGKWYFEVKINTGICQWLIGICNASSALNGDITDAYGRGYWGLDGGKWESGSEAGYGAQFSAGDVIGVAVDLAVGTLTYYKNNVSQGVAFTDITALGTVFAAVGHGISAGVEECTAAFAAASQAYSPPSGYSAWDTLDALKASSSDAYINLTAICAGMVTR
jgi:hypothetical protein